MIYRRQKPSTAFIWLVLTSVLAKLLGFVREVVTAALFGVSTLVDSMNVITTPIIYLRSVFAGTAVSSRLVQVFQKLHHNKKETPEQLLISLLVVITGGSLLVSGVIALFATQLVDVLGSDQLGKYTIDSVNNMQIAVFAVLFLMVAVVVQSYLNSYEYFTLSGLQDTVTNLFYIVGVIGVAKYGLLSFSLGLIAGNAARLAIQLPGVWHVFKTNKSSIAFARDSIKSSLWYLSDVSILILIMMLPNIANVLVVVVTTGLGSGYLAAWQYSEKMIAIFQSVIAFPLGFAITPRLSRYSVANNKKKFNKLFVQSMQMIIVLSLPMVLYLLFFPEDIVRLIFARGEFGERAVELTSTALRYYSLALVSFAPMHIMLQIFYMNSLKFDLGIVYGVSTVLNIVLLFIFSSLWGLAGVGIAFAVAVFIGLLLLVWRLGNHISIKWQPILIESLKIAFVASLSLFIVWGVSPWLTGFAGELLKMVTYLLLVLAFGYLVGLKTWQHFLKYIQEKAFT